MRLGAVRRGMDFQPSRIVCVIKILDLLAGLGNKFCRTRPPAAVSAQFAVGGDQPDDMLVGVQIVHVDGEKFIRGEHHILPPRRVGKFTCEMNPGDGDAGKIETLRALGVNRVSLGCQAFQDEILKKLGRRHTAREIEQTALNLRKAGITNLSFDLMLRLPGQTLEDFRDSLRRCVALEAAQVSLYDLEVHEETLFGRLAKENKLDLSGEEEHARMYESAIEILTGADYEHYEVVNFAKPGLASRHNLTYWHNQEYLGFGPSAFTYLNGIRSQFAPDLERYLEKCENGDWKSDIEDVLTKEEKETETFVTGLRLREGVIPQKFPLIYPRIGKRLAALRYEGLLEEAGEHTRFTLRGQLLSDDVFAFLLEKDTSSKTPLL